MFPSQTPGIEKAWITNEAEILSLVLIDRIWVSQVGLPRAHKTTQSKGKIK